MEQYHSENNELAGKKLAIMIVAIIMIISVLIVVCIMAFYALWEPKPAQVEQSSLDLTEVYLNE